MENQVKESGQVPTASRLIKLPLVCSLTTMSKPFIYSQIAKGVFPAPVKIGSRAVAWRSADVQAWIDSRQAA